MKKYSSIKIYFLIIIALSSCKQVQHLNMDIVVNKNAGTIDYNLLLKNPMWYYQTNHPDAPESCSECFCIAGNGSHSLYTSNWSTAGVNQASPTNEKICLTCPTGGKGGGGGGSSGPCTTQKLTINDVAKYDCQGPTLQCCWENGENAGHVNWFAVSYEASAYWDEKSNDSPDPDHPLPGDWGDSDYNLRFVRDDKALYTRNGCDKGLGVEFYSNETIDQWKNSEWWNAFHSGVDDGLGGAYLNGQYVIATGMAGLDCEHGCYTELHPLYAMFIHIADDPNNDQWAFFVRNWGDEGGCGKADVPLNLAGNITQFNVLIPHDSTVRVDLVKDNVTGIGVNSNSWSINQNFPITAGGSLMTFTLAAPSNHSALYGEFTLKWTPSPGATLRPRGDYQLYKQPVQTQRLEESEKETIYSKDTYARLNKLDARSRKELYSMLHKPDSSVKSIKIKPAFTNNIASKKVPSKRKIEKIDYSKNVNITADTAGTNRRAKEIIIIDQFLKSRGIN